MIWLAAHLRGSLLVLVAAAPAAAAFDDVMLNGSVPANPSDGPTSRLHPVDLDGDGRLDVVSSMPTVNLWRQVDDGRLTPVTALEPVGTAAFADLDGDGQLSILVLQADAVNAQEFVAPFVPGALAVLAGPGDGGGGIFAAAADLDGDGHPDLIADRGGELRTWLGDGVGGLLASVPAGGSVASWTELGDLDLDGRLDLLAGVDANVVPLFGQGDGTFVAQAAVPLLFDVRDVALGHFDGDGQLDAAVGTDAGVQLLKNTGGVLQVWTTAGPVGQCRAVDLADADGDGDEDVVDRRWYQQGAFVHITGAAGVVTSKFFATGGEDVVFACLDGDTTSVLVSNGNGAKGQLTVIACGADGLPLIEDEIASSVQPLALADVDGDGQDELVLFHPQFSFDVVVHEIPGDGTLGPPGPATAFSGAIADARVLDLDGDAFEDLLLHTQGPGLTSAWRPWRSNGDGTFSQGPAVENQGFNALWSLGDLDADGDLDLLIVSSTQSAWYANEFDGTFASAAPATIPGLILAPSTYFDLVLTDADADGLADLFQGSDSSIAQVRMWKGLGSGSFGQPQVLSTDPFATSELRAEDLDGDSDVDLFAVGAADQALDFVSTLTVLHGHGDGSFDAAQHYATNAVGQPDPMGAFDFDGDGRLDVLHGMVLLPQAADGRFGEARPLPVHDISHQQDLFATDMDADGDLDLLAVGPYFVSPAASLRVAWVESALGALDLGHGLAGSAGEPVLTGGGTLVPGAEAFLDLQAAPASTRLLLVLGLQTALLPFGGGTLVPEPEVVLGGLASDGDGRLHLTARWPIDAPDGLVVVVQVWCTDPVTGQPVASNALEYEGD